MTARVYKIEQREAETLLSPVVRLIEWAVALGYIVFGVSLILWAWTLSPIRCGLALAYFTVRKLAGR